MSYDLYCSWDITDLFSKQEQLEDMRDRLAGLGYAEDAARETDELVCMLNQARVRCQTRLNRLSFVWKAVEKWDLCDWGEDQVKVALSKYRGEEEDGTQS